MLGFDICACPCKHSLSGWIQIPNKLQDGHSKPYDNLEGLCFEPVRQYLSISLAIKPELETGDSFLISEKILNFQNRRLMGMR